MKGRAIRAVSEPEPKDRILLLVTSSSYRAEDFLTAAGRLGVEVTVASDHEATLTDLTPGANLRLDFDDPVHAVAAMADFDREYPITAIVTAEDEGALLAAAASATLDLPHNTVDAVRMARRKDLFRQALCAAGIASPRFTTVGADDDHDAVARLVESSVGFPCVLKPVSLAASRGVIRADDPAQLTKAFRRVVGIVRSAARPAPTGKSSLDGRSGLGGQSERSRTSDPNHRLIVEQYLPGTEVAFEGLLVDGELRCLAMLDKPDPLEGPYFEETLFVTPSRLPPRAQEEIRATVSDMAHALGLTHGPVHAELRVNEEGVWPIEIAPRSIGGLCSRLFRFRAGMTLEELILRHATGRPVSEFVQPSGASGVMMIPIPRAGRLEAVEGVDDVREEPEIEDVVISLRPGQEVVPLPEGNRYLGFIFARSDDGPQAVERALRSAHSRLRIRIS